MSKLTPKSMQFCFFFFFILCFAFHGSPQATTSDQEQAVLLKLKQHWQNPPAIAHWNSANGSHCTWPEITCADGSVTRIQLVNMNITGQVPSFICDLKNLTAIDLQFNYIPGEFPTVLYNCSKLQYLDLSQNYFVGRIPDDIDRLTQLQFLSLSANNFSGDIPPAIGRFPELRKLLLFQTQLNGSFPPEIGNLSNLEDLELAYNGFVPSAIPSNFAQLKKLKKFWMAKANLIGEIPEAIGEMTALEYLDITYNDLTGEIPNSLFQLKNLMHLYLHDNQLSGEIPSSVQSLNLVDIDLGQNNLNGTIPEVFGKLESLSLLSLFANQLSGEIPASIGRIPSLTDVKLFSNNLSGVLPPDFGRYSMLEAFEVADNKFTGSLPGQLCAGGVLVGVVAFKNNLTGELPASLGNCSSLEIAKLSGNRFSGNIPAGLWLSFNLSTLAVSDNFFTGTLPEKLARNLSRLEINNNRFHGEIPVGVSSWTNLVVFEASNNLFTGSIPRELTALPLLMTLSLAGNQLSGELPSDIVSWEFLTTLNLSRNRLSGQIPAEIGSLPRLIDLDLSVNHFSGNFPAALASLSQKLIELNLSSNNLSGRIPLQFENTVYSSSFNDNPALCSSNPSLNLKSCTQAQRTSKSSKDSTRFLAVTLSIAIAVSVFAMMFTLFMFRSYCRKKHSLESTWKLTSFQRLGFTDSNIVSNLTENNLIGSGGSGQVFRVAVNHPGDFVAVKSIWSNSKLDHKLEKEFLAEAQILSSIRHSNIVKLLCCISSDDSKLLVYEYLENRSLDRWLHGKKRRPGVNLVHHVVLDWPKRMQIAVGAAQGLCYMHHDCSPPIVHRDVKSSNILLDTEFNAKIADFGLARMLMKQGEPNTVSSVAGSFGYMAPEYAHTARLNEKIDVYSFGVVLLELVTGKEAGDGGENGCLAEWAWQHIQESKPIVEALDDDVKEKCYLDEMCSVFKLGIICTGTLPSSRPSMKEVLRVLLRCRNQQLAYRGNAKSEYEAAPLLKSYMHGKSENDHSFASNV
ncbi:receptor-like protein kinase HSL1 [Malania oleifera]|uniref:receptor-like protein kinase HSL1 n=1 Tax=Malania oleifera TaxID=397392 RepID=UPI0025AE1752|nr:receptor-like protein kinase HSL1 [Malania oleifera]